MFKDLDDTIRQLLMRHVPLELTEVDVSFDAPDREWSGRLSRPTVNCFLYDVRENLEFRETDWEVSRNVGTGTVRRKKAPIRVNAAYQVTVWARAPEDEHRLLWRVLAALSRNPILPRDVAEGGIKDQVFPIPAKVGQPDPARVNPADLWQALDNRIRPALTYIVTLALDPEVEFTSPMVFTRTSRAYLLEEAPADAQPAIRQRQHAWVRHDPEELMAIGGHVRDRKDRAQVVAGASVRLRETGAETQTGADGRFVFPRTPRGSVTFIVRAPGRQQRSIATEVPSPTYDLEV